MREKQAAEAPKRENAWTVATGQAARWIALELDVRAPRTWFGPTWAFLGGVLGAGRMPLEVRSLVILAVGWLLGEPVVGSLLALSLDIAKARRGRGAQAHPPARWELPYVQPGSPGRRLLDALARLTARARGTWDAIEGAGERWVLLALVALVLGAAGGPRLVLSVGLALLGGLMIALGGPWQGPRREALEAGHFLLAWLIGASAFAQPNGWMLLVGVGYAVIWYAWTARPPQVWGLGAALVAVAALMVILHAPVSAGGVLLLAVPLFVLLPAGPGGQRTYLRSTQVYLMASLLLAAWGLAWAF